MIRCSRSALGAGLLAGAGLLLPVTMQAQSSSASYQIPRQSIDAGAGRAASASYTVNGTLGQPDAGSPMTGAIGALYGGVHRAATGTVLPDRLFEDSFESP